MTRMAICALVTGFLAIALSSIPILGLAFGLVSAGAGIFASVKASRQDVRLAAIAGLVLGIVGAVGAINRSMEALAVSAHSSDPTQLHGGQSA